MKIIICFKLVFEEQDIIVILEYLFNFDCVEVKISQFDLNVIEVVVQLVGDGDEIVVFIVGGFLL